MQRSIHERNRSFLDSLALFATQAGEIIMAARRAGVAVEYKDDKSPVTHADEEANHYIVEALMGAFPDIPVVSEEGAQEVASSDAEHFWLVDPLDGTRGFIRGEDEFTVNIGLIENRQPVAGVIYLPAKRELYLGSDKAGAFYARENGEPQPIHVRRPEGIKRAVIMSAYHGSPDTDAVLSGYEITEKVRASSSLKFCYVAEGKADLYPRTGPTMEWDTAAGHAILLAAGGRMTHLDGSVFLYGKEGYRNPGFLASGGA